MKCSFCSKKAIYKKGNIYFCKEHFIEYFEKKVLDTIKKYKLINPGEKVGVAVSGGKDSMALLYFLNKYKEKLNIDLVGIHIDEGIKGYREILTNFLIKKAKELGIKIYIYKFKDYFGYNLDELVNNNRYKPCTICGVWRRWLINKASLDLKLDVLATAHNINDEAQTIILNIIENNLVDLAKLGIKTGIRDIEYFVRRVKPFYFVTEKETTIYSILNKIEPPFVECPYILGQMRDVIRYELYKLDEKYNITENLIKNFLKLKDKLKDYIIKEKNYKINKCKICGFPTSREICKACEIKLFFQKNKNSSMG